MSIFGRPRGFEKSQQKAFYVKRQSGIGGGGGSRGRHPGRGEMICSGTFLKKDGSKGFRVKQA